MAEITTTFENTIEMITRNIHLNDNNVEWKFIPIERNLYRILIIFNKKFVDILPSGTGTRIVSLLKLLGLEKRIVSDYNDFSLIGKEIEYNDVNKKLDIEREKSISILNQIIKD